MKADRLNTDLLSKLRGSEKIESLLVERETMQKYFQTCLKLLKECEEFTDTETDLDILSRQDLSPKMRSLLNYRLERKRIVQSNLHLAQLLVALIDAAPSF